jgi:DNA-binding winged helix-turn-helix (wHTH) protein
MNGTLISWRTGPIRHSPANDHVKGAQRRCGSAASELQPSERRLLADGESVALGARAFDVLLTLAERPGRLVSKRALMDLVWPGRRQENNLAAQVGALRKVSARP